MPDGSSPSPPARQTISRRVVARNTAAVMVARAIDILGALVTLRLLAPHLGPAGYGNWGFTWAFVLAMQPLVNFEMDRILIREAARARDRTRDLWGAALCVKGVLLVPFLIVVAVATQVVAEGRDVALALGIAAVSEVFYHLHMLNSAVFQSRERMDADLALMTGFRVLFVVGIVSGVLADGHLPHFVAVALMAHATRSIVGGAVILRRVGPPRFHDLTATIRSMVRMSAPLTLSAILAGLTLNVEIFILKGLAPPEDVGYFQLAHPILFQLQIVPGALMTALFPGFARTFTQEPSRLAGFVRQATRIFFLVGGLMALGLYAVAGPLIGFLGAGEFDPAVAVLQTLALALPGIFAMTLFSFSLVAADGQRDLAIGSAAGLLTNVALGLILVPIWQSFGAGLATAGAYYIMGSGYAALASRHLPGIVDRRFLAGALTTLAVTGAALGLARNLPAPLAAVLAGLVFLPGGLLLSAAAVRDLVTARRRRTPGAP